MPFGAGEHVVVVDFIVGRVVDQLAGWLEKKKCNVTFTRSECSTVHCSVSLINATDLLLN